MGSQRQRSTSWAGACQIVRFNWPSYAAAFIVSTLASLYVPRTSGPGKVLAVGVLAGTVYLSIASFLASHFIYDLSLLTHWSWLKDWLPQPLGRWILVQTGFDSTHGRILQELVKPVAIVDLYGTPGIGGSSVQRARQENDIGANVLVALPLEHATCDTILAVFALHEIQTPFARSVFFKKLSRILSAGGQLVVVEHLRDWRNFLVFGPGFFHFLPEQEWRRCGAAAGLVFEKERSVTPFVRIFLWRKA